MDEEMKEERRKEEGGRETADIWREGGKKL